MWRFWSSCKLRTLTSATDELASLNTPGKRQVLVATTIENDPTTIAVAHAAFRNAIATFRSSKVKRLSWTLVLQPFLPEWVRKGDPNPLGLDEGTDKPLINVSFTVNWPNIIDDEFMKSTTRHAVEQIEAFAAANNTGHRYRYINYCTEWQQPFESYGDKNWKFLRQVSREYDPEGLFQRGCLGGFKLDALDDRYKA
jgi:FAD/FMN-containing dehydrogenase